MGTEQSDFFAKLKAENYPYQWTFNAPNKLPNFEWGSRTNSNPLLLAEELSNENPLYGILVLLAH